MSKWKEKSLAEIAENKAYAIVDGPFGTQLHASEYQKEGVPVVRVVNTTYDGRFDDRGLVYISEAKANSLKRSEVIPGDVIVAKTGATIGKSGIFPSKFPRGIVASSCLKISVDTEKADNRFVARLIESHEGQRKIIAGAGGSTRTTINIKPFSAIRFVFPDEKDEQTQIAEILSMIDSAIERTEAIIEKQNRIKTGLMQDLLTKGIDENGNIRSEKTHEFRDSPLGRIPIVWRLSSLRKVSQNGARNGYFKKPELVGSGYKLINVSEIYQPFGMDTNLPDVERVIASSNDLEKYGVENGDIFFTRSSLVLSGIAYCNIIRFVKEPTLFECHVMRIRPNQEMVVPEFVAYFCLGSFARRYFMSQAKHVTMATISQHELESLIIPFPERDEQKSIVDILLDVGEVIEKEKIKRMKLERIKTGLMQDLLTGMVTVTGLLDKKKEIQQVA